MTRIVIAADSFKGSATSQQVGEYLTNGIYQVDPEASVVTVPMADGGEGTVASVLAALGGERRTTRVTGPVGQPVDATWGWLPDQHMAVIEMAAAAGLNLVQPDYAPRTASTYGVGQLIDAALTVGATTIYVGLGGSGTTDGGAGMLQALGARLLTATGDPIPRGGAGLRELALVDLSGLDDRLARVNLVALTDVENVLTGPYGAAAVFGPQKGATPEMVQELDANLTHYQAALAAQNAFPLSCPGDGAAGGTGFGLRLLGATLAPGTATMLKLTQLAAKLQVADLVLTGEGRVDGQSLMGKAPIGVAKLAHAAQVPVILIAGSVGDDLAAVYAAGVDLVLSSTVAPMTVDQAITQTKSLLTNAGATAMRAYQLGH
ncbi:glycerate kinase [Levilactobacillus namurensis]|uniref:glycerate kinase n=1 Tax=Levilactobacillus namurensis TaxID=380393 RepID=UPI001E1A36F2|nr:glycerate kinase [Levilactobacillus namurensis]HJE44152.1 glycerate kinase [Levilactobacillus namurensis]